MFNKILASALNNLRRVKLIQFRINIPFVLGTLVLGMLVGSTYARAQNGCEYDAGEGDNLSCYTTSTCGTACGQMGLSYCTVNACGQQAGSCNPLLGAALECDFGGCANPFGGCLACTS